MAPKTNMKTLISNKKIRLDYELLTKYEAGISLFGFEVKSVKDAQGSLTDSYVLIRDGEAYLVNASIPAYQPKNTPESYDPYRERKILLNKKEIAELKDAVKQSNLTIAPISMYNKGSKIKLEIALVRGKKKFDKRLTIKKRDIEKDLGRRLKN